MGQSQKSPVFLISSPWDPLAEHIGPASRVAFLAMPRLSEVWSTVQSASTLCFNWEKCRERLRLRLYQPAKQFSYSLTSAGKWGQEVKPTSQGEVLQQAYSYWVHCIKSAMPSLSTTLWAFAIWRQLLSLEIPAKLGKNVMTSLYSLGAFSSRCGTGQQKFWPKSSQTGTLNLAGICMPSAQIHHLFSLCQGF